MNSVAQKRISEYINKISDTILSALGKDYSDSFKAKLVSLLAETGQERAENIVLRHLQQNPNQEEAILAACKFENEEVDKFLSLRLEDERAAHRDVIAEQLGFRDKNFAFKILKKLLSDKDRHVRFQAAYSLFNLGDKDSALALCQYISDPDEWISMTILRILCIMKEHETIPILTEKFHQDDDLRRKALMVSFLARFRSVTLINIFDEGIRGHDARLKANSIEAIGNLNLPHKEIKARVEPFLRDPNNRIRANSILALARSEPETVKPEIIEMCVSNDVQLRRSAAFILAMIPAEGYKEQAEKMLQDPNDAVRTRMVASLKNFPSDFVSSQLEKVLSDSNKWIRKYAIDMASKISNFPSDKILSLLKTERAAPNLESCIKFFVTHPSESAVSALKLHVKDRRLRVVKALLDAMASINGIAGVESIAPRLDRKDPRVINALTQTMLKLGKKEAVESLIEGFSKAKREKQLAIMIPSIKSCLETFTNPENMSEPLIESLSHIELTKLPKSQSEEVNDSEQSEDSLNIEIPEVTEGEIDVSQFATNEQQKQENQTEIPSLNFSLPEEKPKKRKIPVSYKKGVKAYNLGKYKKSYKLLNAALDDDIECPAKINFYLGICAFEVDKFEEAKNHLHKFLIDHPENSKANYVLGKVYKELREWKKLIVAFTKFIDGTLDAPEKLKKKIYYEVGIAHVLVGNNNKGEQLLERLSRVLPDNVEVVYYLALSRFNLGKPSAAAALLTELLNKEIENERIKKLSEALLLKIRTGASQ